MKSIVSERNLPGQEVIQNKSFKKVRLYSSYRDAILI